MSSVATMWSKLGESWVVSAATAVGRRGDSTHRWWSTWPTTTSHTINHIAFKQCHATLLQRPAGSAAISLLTCSSIANVQYIRHATAVSRLTHLFHIQHYFVARRRRYVAIFISEQPPAAPPLHQLHAWSLNQLETLATCKSRVSITTALTCEYDLTAGRCNAALWLSNGSDQTRVHFKHT